MSFKPNIIVSKEEFRSFFEGPIIQVHVSEDINSAKVFTAHKNLITPLSLFFTNTLKEWRLWISTQDGIVMLKGGSESFSLQPQLIYCGHLPIKEILTASKPDSTHDWDTEMEAQYKILVDIEDSTLAKLYGLCLYGITCAATFHRIHPTSRILILESTSSIGGPWASHRIFPGLKTNNLWGTYENPDFPMGEEKFSVKKGEHVPADKVTEYLKAFIEETGIDGCLRLGTKVEVVEKMDEGWRLHCNSTSSRDGGGSKFVMSTAKLILSVGLVNRPSIPRYPTSPDFAPKVIHSIDFPHHFPTIVSSSTHTLVIGSGKSAWDVAYACATQPSSTATMLIRPSGNGPIWMSPPYVTPLGLWLEKLVFTRFFGYMSPCPWAEMSGFEGWIRTFLHGTWLGRKIVGAFWGILGDDVIQLNKLNEHPETKKLRPWRDAFEVGNALSIMNYPTNFFDLVREGKIKVIIDEVEKCGVGKEVVLKGGQKMKVDAVVCATGWKSGAGLKFKPEGLEKELGLPTKNMPDTDDAALVEKVKAEIFTRYPFMKSRDTSRLHHPDPSLRHTQTSDPNQQPYRLYRFLIPPSDLQHRSIGFAGALMSLGNASCAYLQSLWLAAYFDGTLPLPEVSSEQLKYETYRDTQYCALRNAMGYGNKFPDLVFDSLPYFDALMRDLGFDGKRKGMVFGMKNWGAESFRSYGPEDYRGLVDEWQKRVEGDGEGKKNV
ncbi:FAD/NAD(P)-binding domain-containing protein [Massarina eburnea CBS 473.64]|uniref:L-ornithine N(5)-monooxygenase [NAD(P)H] n=1 Tax=Massarina eburnea CBS 473.64 TaxID=1395130 RepID=A0A6A6S2E5_9PLEO|nr:FAD/NAD(P)-binding domain-containing protein [Massarina eburnea CBS 473.64]